MENYLDIGSFNFEKRYDEAIRLAEKLLADNPHDSNTHINVMVSYFKSGNIEKSTYHAKQAMLYGHHTGYAEERLAINLDKAKLFHQSLQLYSLILDNKAFHFSRCGCGNDIDWGKRRENAQKRLSKALDTENDILFTDAEVAQIIQGIKDADLYEHRKQIHYDNLSAMFKKQIECEYDGIGRVLLNEKRAPLPNSLHEYIERTIPKDITLAEARSLAPFLGLSIAEVGTGSGAAITIEGNEYTAIPSDWLQKVLGV